MRLALVLAATLALAATAACGGAGDGGLPTATIIIGAGEGVGAELTVELAHTAAERSRGLMFREELPEERGMLFVYREDTTAGFWMKDTSIPLSIAFIAAAGTILDVQDMEPLSTDLHRPPGPYRYALEVNQGWFGRNGFAAGARVEIPETVTAGD